MKLLHISDTHGYSEGTADAFAIAREMSLPMVHTGDMVKDYFQQDLSYLDMPNMWPVIGNHDAINLSGTHPSGYDWHDKPSQTELRTKFFDPYQGRGLIFPTETATWWHKDVEGCRIIGLDVTALGNDLTSELNWLRDTLNNTPTIVLNHIGPRDLDYTNDGFTCAAYWHNDGWYNHSTDNDYPGIAQLSDIVFAHAERSGTPCAMLCGHEHADGATVHRGVPVISIGSIYQDNYNNVYRSETANTARTVTNLVTFDGMGLTVQRLGADSRITGSRAKMWAYSYVEKRVTAIVSR